MFLSRPLPKVQYCGEPLCDREVACTALLYNDVPTKDEREKPNISLNHLPTCPICKLSSDRSSFNPLPAKLSYLIFHPFEVVSRYSDTQLQVGEKYSYLSDLRPNIYNTDLTSIYFTHKTVLHMIKK